MTTNSNDQNYADLFNAQVEINDGSSKNKEEYSPSSDKGSNGVYQSFIRFIPWWQNPKGSISEKWTSFLVDPFSGKGKFVDCPSSVGQPSPLQDIYWKLFKSESAQEKALAPKFSRKRQFACLVQVIQDPHNKEAEGKILVWRFGVKVWEKINAELKPPMGDPSNPFDLLKGKIFALKITKVSDYNNYDQSQFVQKAIPLVIPNEQGKLVAITEKTDKGMVFNYLKEHSPDLSKYAYKEWDQDTRDYVNQVIVAVTGMGTVPSKIASVSGKNANPASAAKPATTSGITSQNISVEDLNTDMNFSNLPGDVDLPELPGNNFGIGGDLNEALRGL